MASCKDRRKLAEVFATAGREYSEAITRLVAHEVLSAAKYRTLRLIMIEALDRCDRARIEFEQHLAMHRCGESHFASASDVSSTGTATAA